MSTTIHEENRKLADELKPFIKIAKDGDTSETDKGLYDKHAEAADLPKETREKLQRYNAKFFASFGLAFGELAQEAAKKNPDLDKITIEVPMDGKDHVSFTWEKEYDASAPGAKEKTIKYGRLTPKLTIFGVQNRGDMAKVKEHLVEKAAEAFGG